MLPSLVVVAQRRFCLAAGTRLPEPCGVCMVADPAPRSQWQSIRRLWLRIRGSALLWLRLVDGVPLASTDILGGAVALVGMGIIVSGWGTAA